MSAGARTLPPAERRSLCKRHTALQGAPARLRCYLNRSKVADYFSDFWNEARELNLPPRVPAAGGEEERAEAEQGEGAGLGDKGAGEDDALIDRTA